MSSIQSPVQRVCSQIVGLQVKSKSAITHQEHGFGKVIDYFPLQASLSDAIVEFESGLRVATETRMFDRVDGGALPDRAQLRAEADRETVETMRQLLAEHVRAVQSGEPWPNLEFGKAMVGNMFLNVLESLGCDRVAELKRACAGGSSTI